MYNFTTLEPEVRAIIIDEETKQSIAIVNNGVAVETEDTPTVYLYDRVFNARIITLENFKKWYKPIIGEGKLNSKYFTSHMQV